MKSSNRLNYKDQLDRADAPEVDTEDIAEVKSIAYTSVSVVISAHVITNGDQTFYPAISVQEPLRCYLVPTDSFTPTRQPIELINPQDAYIQAYDWAEELAKMVPDVETVRRNILVSFWRAGAFDRAKAKASSVRSNMFNQAFPYKLEDTQ